MLHFPFINKMESIIKHVFEKENLGVIDGEIVQLDPTKYECRFGLTMTSLELFEEEFGKPLINVFFGDNQEETQNPDFTRALACSCYLKLENNEVFQNQATKEEFKNLEIYKACSSDLVFVGKIVKMALESISEKVAKQAEEEQQKVKN